VLPILSKVPRLPSGYILDQECPPSPRILNRLLSKCNQETFPISKLEIALQNSAFYLSILSVSSENLIGFVRATSDKGLNTNLWNLAVIPCDDQEILISFLVYQAMFIIKRDMPGCSVSVAAPLMSLESLKMQGFLLDPGGIRAMGLKLR
tara:strand:- start:2818 stop:3267 length:450 start_codon:yes stop_codon:yes gene_type:complete